MDISCRNMFSPANAMLAIIILFLFISNDVSLSKSTGSMAGDNDKNEYLLKNDCLLVKFTMPEMRDSTRRKYSINYLSITAVSYFANLIASDLTHSNNNFFEDNVLNKYKIIYVVFDLRKTKYYFRMGTRDQAPISFEKVKKIFLNLEAFNLEFLYKDRVRDKLFGIEKCLFLKRKTRNYSAKYCNKYDDPTGIRLSIELWTAKGMKNWLLKRTKEGKKIICRQPEGESGYCYYGE